MLNQDLDEGIDKTTDRHELPAYWPRPRMRISGTAMPTGVCLSTGWVRTATDWELVLTGLAIMGLAGVSGVVSFVIIWLLGGSTHVPLVGILLGAVGNLREGWVLWQIAANLILFAVFLVILRLSPLAGFHAAEHMTVTCIERLGRVDPEQVRWMPRAHPRCGTSLLAGVVPLFLISFPMWDVSPGLALLVFIVGWLGRDFTGYWIQQIFTTKPPSPKQLQAGLRSGQRLLAMAEKEGTPPISPAQWAWRRGLPQMAFGAIAGIYILNWIVNNLPMVLDHAFWAAHL